MIPDAGVFIALDDPSRRGLIVALVEDMIAEGTTPATNTAALAQAWRNPATQVALTRLVKTTTVHPFGDPRTIGMRCATTDTSDVVDASLAVLADQLGQSIRVPLREVLTAVTVPIYGHPMAEDVIWFTESEVAQVLWVLTEATELAADANALSTLAHIEEVLRLVRERFDRHRPTDS